MGDLILALLGLVVSGIGVLVGHVLLFVVLKGVLAVTEERRSNE